MGHLCLNKLKIEIVFAWQVMLSFFFKTIRIQNARWFWVLKTLSDQNTYREIIASVASSQTLYKNIWIF